MATEKYENSSDSINVTKKPMKSDALHMSREGGDRVTRRFYAISKLPYKKFKRVVLA